MTVAKTLEWAASYVGEECLPWPRRWGGKRPNVVAGCHPLITTGMSASRAVYLVHLAQSSPNPQLAQEDWVLHSCGGGQKGCVNLAHLYIGNAGDNARDRERDGHTARGSKAGKSKLAQSQVISIRGGDDGTREYVSLMAFTHGVSESAIYQILTGKTWKHLL